MLGFVTRRLVMMLPLLILVSIISFTIMQLPPGSYIDSYIATMQSGTVRIEQYEIDQIIERYGLNQPAYVQYFKWMTGIFTKGDFGRSFQWNRPVGAILRERLPMTIVLSFSTMVFVWIIAVPIGIYSATHQYSVFDYIWTFVGFIGLSVPNFLFALVMMWVVYIWFGLAVTGLFSPEYVNAAWSFAKLIDMLKHVWLPLIVIGAAGTAGIIRVMRATLLDELRKQYVVTARAKGLREKNLLFKYPIRVAINPLISTIGWILPMMISGEIIVSIVLNLQTVGPVFLTAILSQDMYLAGSIVMLISGLTVLGTFISDLLLAALDPRIRYGERT